LKIGEIFSHNFDNFCVFFFRTEEADGEVYKPGIFNLLKEGLVDTDVALLLRAGLLVV